MCDMDTLARLVNGFFFFFAIFRWFSVTFVGFIPLQV